MSLDPTSTALQAKSLSDWVKEVESGEEAAAGAVDEGVVKQLATTASSDAITADEIRDVGRVAFALVKPKDLRLKFVDAGGFKVLCDLLARITPENSSAAIPACHAYARLLMTTPPGTLFFKGHALVQSSGLAPLFLLLVNPDSTKQQVYEAVMALASMATLAPTMGSRIVNGSINLGDSEPEKIVPRIEQLLRSPETLLVRAASQLVCNLTSSKAGWYHWSGETRQFDFPGEPNASDPQGEANPSQDEDGVLDPQAGARLGVLLLLTKHEDPATRRSAAASLAVLTQSEKACSALLQLKIVTNAGTAELTPQLWLSLVALFSQQDDKHLKTRAAIVGRNILRYIGRFLEPQKTQEMEKARAAGLTEALQKEMTGVSNEDMIETLQAACKVV